MYLSKVFINFKKPKNIYQIHQDLWSLFPNQEDQDRSFLFRVEQQVGLGASILLQSELKPIVVNKHTNLLAVRDYPISVQENQKFRFLLVANPIKTIKDEKARLNKKGLVKSNRVPLIKEEEQENWLARKLCSWAKLESLVIRPCHPLYFYKKDEEQKGYGGKIVPVAFEGVFNLQNPDEMIKNLKTGIGPAKAFGCGLLSISKL